MNLDRPPVDRKPPKMTGLHVRVGGTGAPVLEREIGRSNASKRRRVLAAVCLVLAASAVAGFFFFVEIQGPSYFDRLVWAASLDDVAPIPADFVPQRGDSDCGPGIPEDGPWSSWPERALS